MEKNEYKEEVKVFMIDNYKPDTICSLAKRFELTFDEGEEEKAEMVSQLIDKIFAEERLYEMFCVMRQYKKYGMNADALINHGKAFAKVPEIFKREKCEIQSIEEMSICDDKVQVANQDDVEFKQNLKAVIIGVGKDVYGRDNGSNCVQDAEAVREFLIHEWHVKEENIAFLPVFMPGKKPRYALENIPGYVSGKNANEILKAMYDSADENDNFLFYFSGYGAAVNGKSYLMLSDSYIHGKTARNALRLISVNEILRRCKARVKIRIFDANFSGQRLEEMNLIVRKNLMGQMDDIQTICGNQEIIPRINVPFVNDIDEIKDDILDYIEAEHGWITLTSCDVDQKAFECDQIGHGIFTYYLLKGLEGAARRQNRKIYVEDLKNYVCRKVMKTMCETEKVQTPQYQCELIGNLIME